MSLALLRHAFAFLTNLHWTIPVRVCWFFFVFDFPRYVLTDIYILFCELLRRRRPSAAERQFLARLPLVSVVVPALNEERTVTWTVHSLLEQTYQNLEIIIVDDGSTDRTPDICRELARNPRVHYLRFGARGGKSAALNHGLAHARGEFVVFVDSDTTFDRDAIQNILRAFADPLVGAVSGNLAPRNGGANILTALQRVEYLFTISVGRRIQARFGTLPIVSGALGAFRAEIIGLLNLGGHEPGPGNDSDLTIRVRKRGGRIAFAPDAMCLTNVPESWPSLVRQRWRWDRTLVLNRLRKHKNVFNPLNANFRLLDVISFTDTIFFHVVLACMTIVYLVDMVANFRDLLPFLLALHYVIYLVTSLVELAVAVALTRRWSDLTSIIYLPLFIPYKILLKFFRLIGYAQELFFELSFRDPFAPPKVQRRMIRW